MSHIGTTPCKFKIDVFVSYIENIKHASDVCITWERRGKVQGTNLVQVRDGKAVLRETMSMESTLFKRNVKDKAKQGQGEMEQLKFDEKKVKFVLRKGGSEGKAIGKISMDIAQYVRGVSSTVFADLKLSNGSVIVSKIEANMLHMGRMPKNGSNAGSETYSEMSDSNGIDNDSLFGEDEEEDGDFEIPATMTPPSKEEAEAFSTRSMMSPMSTTDVSSSKSTMSPASTTSSTSAQTSQAIKEPGTPRSRYENSEIESSENDLNAVSKRRSVLGAFMSKQREGELKPSPSLRQKLKNKMMAGRKESDEDAESSELTSLARRPKSSRGPSNEAEVRELRLLVESIKEENTKLRKGKQAAMDEIDALRSDLEACESALEEATSGDDRNNTGSCSDTDAVSLSAKDKRIAELSAQNENLIEELEELHQGDAKTNRDGKGTRDIIKTLRNRIEDLEVALRREPQFLEVVNELKVTKVSLALANMEREQAIFALQNLKQDLGVDD